ncbi:hypothetical protein RPHASCH2410_CH08705 [Rhizobium phaseoli Ch24-10]|nr:hypothetical protein RPHASCH2410_CH08705 [Rhizobium phaseoli Ch24-10]
MTRIGLRHRGFLFASLLFLFSPAGRRWPEGSDEGATQHNIHGPSLALRAFAALPLTPSSVLRTSSPAGEKGESAVVTCPAAIPHRRAPHRADAVSAHRRRRPRHWRAPSHA